MTQVTIDTSSADIVVGLVHDQACLEKRSSSRRRGDIVLPLLAELLQEGGLTMHDIDEIVVRRGIGSYTGLRVGIATASGLAWALSIPLVGLLSRARRPLSAHEMFRHPGLNSEKTVRHWPTIVPSYQRWRPTHGFGKLHAKDGQTQ